MNIIPSRYMLNGSYMYNELKRICGNHEYALCINGETGWEDDLTISDLPELCKIHNATSCYFYCRESDTVKVYVM